MHRLIQRLLSKTNSKISPCKCAQWTDMTPQYAHRLLFMFVIRKYRETNLMKNDDPEIAKGMIDASAQMLQCFTAITNSVYRHRDLRHVDSTYIKTFGCRLVKYINRFIEWTKHHIRNDLERTVPIETQNKAATTIARYWRARFKHNTLRVLIDRARKAGISIEATSRMR